MPDEQGNFKPGFVMRGRGGELLDGYRLVTELKEWTAQIAETDDTSRVTMRVTVQRHEPYDRFTYEHAPDEGLRFEVSLGRKMMAGPARILGRIPQLVIESTVEVA
jgi:hypothetical protein